VRCLFRTFGELSPQVEDVSLPLILHLLTALTAQINGLNAEVEGENKSTTKNYVTSDFFRDKLKLRKTQRIRLSGQKVQYFITNHVKERDICEVLKSLRPCSG
jgi:hypothetical protein